jgi:predicted nucleic acid-binding protein
VTRFAIDDLTALRLVREGIVVSEEHQLVAPNVLRSRVLSHLYRAVRDGTVSRNEAREQLDRLTSMRVRLLGDRVSRAVAWQIAEQLGWDDTTNAEFVAVAKLQADVFVTLDADLARQVDGIVTIAPFEALVGREA